MKNIYLLLFLLLTNVNIQAQSLSDINFGTQSTLDIITWNIEQFPKNGIQTLDSVTQIIQSLDADIIGLQEINNIPTFNNMVNKIEGFSAYYFPDWQEGLAYVYKNSTIEIVDSYYIYATETFIFPRAPLVIEVMFKNEKYIIINNHLKCCGDGDLYLADSGDEETRRYNAMALLKEYIEYYYEEENVILLGDLNDELDDYTADNVFQAFIDDSENYYFTDLEIALNANASWSYPSWPSHLDHILISNELFDEYDAFASTCETIRIDDYMNSFSQYDNMISDHRPVGLKLFIDENTSNSNLNNSAESKLYISPNPASANCLIKFAPNKKTQIEIYNSKGIIINSFETKNENNSINWETNHLPNGIYFVKLYTENGKSSEVEKVIVQH